MPCMSFQWIHGEQLFLVYPVGKPSKNVDMRDQERVWELTVVLSLRATERLKKVSCSSS